MPTDPDPDERALLAWVAPRLDDADLDEIAAADYGHDVPGHRRGLLELVRSHGLPEELVAAPADVLALTRWTTPDDEHGHLRRLFACTLLVRAVTADANPVDSLARLVESARELGEAAQAAAVRYLAWCRATLPGDWRDDPSAAPFLTLAVLLLSARRSTAPAVAAELVEELDGVLRHPDLPWRRRPGSPLHARRDGDTASTRRLWSALAQHCLVDDPGVTDPRLVALGRAFGDDAAVTVDELRALLRPPG